MRAMLWSSMVVCGAVAGAAWADGPRVAIVAAATNTADAHSNPRYTDPRDKLEATGLFDSVDIIDATRFGSGTPTLDELLAYDAVLTWSNVNYEDAVAMGDVLADYVDAGGGVVVAVFANTSTSMDRHLQGRWQDGDYIAIPQRGGHTEGPGQLGAVLLPDHPIMNGVEEFIARWGVTQQGLIFGGHRPTSRELTEGSTLVAHWDDGSTLVALAPNPRVVELGFHPVSSDVNESAYWDADTDGDLLMANALIFVGGGARPCAADWDGDGDLASADFFAYLADFFAGNADFDGDGGTDSGDFFAFLSAFFEGC